MVCILRVGSLTAAFNSVEAMRTSPQAMYSQTELVVVFHAPVHGVAGQSVPAAQRDDTPTFDMAESALHCDPERTVPVEPEVVDDGLRPNRRRPRTEARISPSLTYATRP